MELLPQECHSHFREKVQLKFAHIMSATEEPTLEELVEVARREKTAEIHDREDALLKEGLFSPRRPDWTPHTVNKRGNKSKPREISSKRPVPVGRDRCLGIGRANESSRSVRNFDPRFEEHCGDLREEHVERNYSFVNTLKETYKRHLENALSKDDSDDHAIRELNRLEQEEARQEAASRRKEILKSLRTEEKEAVKRGKKPYFLKEKDIRRLELEAKFEDVKKQGGVSKYIQKRRRRIASKDRKLLPERRQASQHTS